MGVRPCLGAPRGRKLFAEGRTGIGSGAAFGMPRRLFALSLLDNLSFTILFSRDSFSFLATLAFTLLMARVASRICTSDVRQRANAARASAIVTSQYPTLFLRVKN